MKAVIQLVSKASVTVEQKEKREIGPGYVILLGVAEGDTEEIMKKMVKKIIDLRLFQDENGKTNLSIEDIGGELLVVSQFTLLADCRKGRRPSFIKAGNPAEAEKMYREFILPFDRYILEHCGGGVVHFCGRGDHYIDQLVLCKGITGIQLSQPEFNQMEKIYRHTVDIGLRLLALPASEAEGALRVPGRSSDGSLFPVPDPLQAVLRFAAGRYPLQHEHRPFRPEMRKEGVEIVDSGIHLHRLAMRNALPVDLDPVPGGAVPRTEHPLDQLQIRQRQDRVQMVQHPLSVHMEDVPGEESALFGQRRHEKFIEILRADQVGEITTGDSIGD